MYRGFLPLIIGVCGMAVVAAGHLSGFPGANHAVAEQPNVDVQIAPDHAAFIAASTRGPDLTGYALTSVTAVDSNVESPKVMTTWIRDYGRYGQVTLVYIVPMAEFMPVGIEAE